MAERTIVISESLWLAVYDGPPEFDDGLVRLYDGTNEAGTLISHEELPRLIEELTKLAGEKDDHTPNRDSGGTP